MACSCTRAGEADLLRREAFGHVVPALPIVVHNALSLEVLQDLNWDRGPVRLGVFEGELECRTFEVAGQHQQVVRVYQGVLRRLVEEVLRMVHEVLVQGVAGGDEACRGEVGRAARAAHLLPGRCDRPGVPGQ